MQPVQDLTVEDRVSRTQYPVHMEDADAQELATMGATAGRQAADACRSCAMSPAISRTAGCEANLVIDRDTASRLGILPQAIDDTLYDAFGQRQVSTIFTQLNQYHVVLEVRSAVPAEIPDVAEETSMSERPAPATQVPLSFIHAISRPGQRPLGHQSPGTVSGGTLSFNLAPGVSLGDAYKAIEQAEAGIGMPASIHTQLSGHRRSLSAIRCRTSPG